MVRTEGRRRLPNRDGAQVAAERCRIIGIGKPIATLTAERPGRGPRTSSKARDPRAARRQQRT